MNSSTRRSAYSKRYPSNQVKLGPAPFASFESETGLSFSSSRDEDQPPSQVSQEPTLSNIQEVQSPKTPLSRPISNPISQSQTPSTPIINISNASTPDSSSSSEKELFNTKLIALDEQELRSSTEELLKEDSSNREEELKRRASCSERKRSLTPELELLLRKHSMGSNLNQLLTDNRPTSSLSCGPRVRPHSPYSLKLETSFCGCKPIPTQSMELDSPPTIEVQVNQSRKNSTASRTSQRPSSSSHWRSVNQVSCNYDWGEKPSEETEVQGDHVIEEKRETKCTSNRDVDTCTTNQCSNVNFNHSTSFKSSQDSIASQPVLNDSSMPVLDSPIKESIMQSDSECSSPDSTLPVSMPVLKTCNITPTCQRKETPLLPLERPRCSSELKPAKLEHYINNSNSDNPDQVEKIKIQLPRSDSEKGRRKSSVGASNWVEFAEMGLSSPGRKSK